MMNIQGGGQTIYTSIAIDYVYFAFISYVYKWKITDIFIYYLV